MPNIASVLKSEIARIARKEIRAEVDILRKAVTSYRSEIAALKRRSQSLEQALRQVQKATPAPKPAFNADPDKAHRFSAKRLAAHRARLELSADALGLLLGATGQSIYNWEAGKARPRANHLAAIAALRTLSKAQAARIVAERQTSSAASVR